MRTMIIPCLLATAGALAAGTSTDKPNDKPKLPRQLQGITIDQRLGAQLPLDTVFQDETGRSVTLGSFFHTGKPVLLALVYYTCPMLCSQVLTGVVHGLKPLDIKAGRDYNVVAISFNPSETPADASAYRDLYSAEYSNHARSPGWHFLVGQPDSIKAVTEAAGFHYRWDAATKTYFHAAGIMMATPEGRMARYFYGVEYKPSDLKLGLMDSSHNTIGSPVDKILLFCCQYDPTTGKYTTDVLNLLRVAAALSLLGMAAVFMRLSGRTLFGRPRVGS